MRKRLLFCLLVLTTSTTTFFTSCHRSDRDEDTDLNSATDMSYGESEWNDIYTQLDEVAAVLADVNRTIAPPSTLVCATVTVNPPLPSTVFPKTVTIDFGTVNCMGPDGKNRRGQLIAVFSGKYRDSLTVITINTNGYYVNDNRITGTKTITNRGHISGIMTFSVVVQNGMIMRPDGKTMTWNSTRTRRWIAGESTLGIVSDDVYEITGTASGTGFKGNSFTVTITSPLTIAMNCRWITKGTLNLQPANLYERIVDFGSGTCDDQATVTINGSTYPITMP